MLCRASLALYKYSPYRVRPSYIKGNLFREPTYVNLETNSPAKVDLKSNIRTPFTLERQQGLLKLIQYLPFSIWSGSPIYELTKQRVVTGGRNHTGRVVKRYQSGGDQHRTLKIDYNRARKDIFATVLRIEKSKCRTTNSALLQYDDGVLSYIPAPVSTRPGDRLISSINADILPGNNLPLKYIPAGSIIHNIELIPGTGGRIIRTAGEFATITEKSDHWITVKLPSTEVRQFLPSCWATIGQLSWIEHASIDKMKAGVLWHLGKRPGKTGLKMSKRDHPHGGGSRKSNAKRPIVSAWGVHTDGFKTRSKTQPIRTNTFRILQRRVAGRIQKRNILRNMQN